MTRARADDRLNIAEHSLPLMSRAPVQLGFDPLRPPAELHACEQTLQQMKAVQKILAERLNTLERMGLAKTDHFRALSSLNETIVSDYNSPTFFTTIALAELVKYQACLGSIRLALSKNGDERKQGYQQLAEHCDALNANKDQYPRLVQDNPKSLAATIGALVVGGILFAAGVAAYVALLIAPIPINPVIPLLVCVFTALSTVAGHRLLRLGCRELGDRPSEIPRVRPAGTRSLLGSLSLFKVSGERAGDATPVAEPVVAPVAGSEAAADADDNLYPVLKPFTYGQAS